MMYRRTIRSSILRLSWLAGCVCSMSCVRATDLMEVYRDALANDPTFQAASATRMASREARPEAWAALLPQISGSAGRTRDHSSGYQSNVTLSGSGTLFPFAYQNTGRATNDQWSLNLSQAVFSWTDWMNVRAAEREVAE